ncbi:DICT sensory domain-containing protein [Microbacterium sp. ARD31]|uniref:DICT sensory domain-containing protein n=1 Tax=Microbacterium sp. ARD31 TaxID=2962576 RepID=UPI002880E830|nr:DICT sensory domain-containing protein [Microbacterium sp. ARD31]MDT0188268.1 DICT sensory domain-containing protein [Microbacterium sp. ARD31]
MESTSSPLTIGDLAARTGVPIATIRSWESRYGFPSPSRAPGGHRRYVEGDVAAVAEVLAHRRAGLSLEAAVRRTTTTPVRPRSVYAEVRRHHPELTAQVLSKATLSALSHAIEDECCARAAVPLLFAGFQREEFLRHSQVRWAELARTARAAVTFAHAAAPAPVADGLLTEVRLPDDAPLNREWFVVCDATDLPAFLAAVELPRERAVPDAQRSFEALWSVDPQVVRVASRAAAAIADDYRPDWRPTGERVPESDDPPPASGDLARASALFDRMLGYVESSRT